MVRAHKPPQRPIDVQGECPYADGNALKYSTKCVWLEKSWKTWHDADIACGREAAKLGSHIKVLAVVINQLREEYLGIFDVFSQCTRYQLCHG